MRRLEGVLEDSKEKVLVNIKESNRRKLTAEQRWPSGADGWSL